LLLQKFVLFRHSGGLPGLLVLGSRQLKIYSFGVLCPAPVTLPLRLSAVTFHAIISRLRKRTFQVPYGVLQCVRGVGEADQCWLNHFSLLI
jgi:hypothetical protein